LGLVYHGHAPILDHGRPRADIERFVAFSSGLKGAGDTCFVRTGIAILSFCVLILPTAPVVLVLHWGMLGAWKQMRLIESP